MDWRSKLLFCYQHTWTNKLQVVLVFTSPNVSYSVYSLSLLVYTHLNEEIVGAASKPNEDCSKLIKT